MCAIFAVHKDEAPDESGAVPMGFFRGDGDEGQAILAAHGTITQMNLTLAKIAKTHFSF